MPTARTQAPLELDQRLHQRPFVVVPLGLDLSDDLPRVSERYSLTVAAIPPLGSLGLPAMESLVTDPETAGEA